MSEFDYQNGLIDGGLYGPKSVPAVPSTALMDASVELVIALKKTEKSRDEWKVYAKQLEAVVEGFAAMRDALREEIVHCTAPHPLRETAEQMKLYDAAYIAEAKRNGLPESQWSEKVLARRDQK